MDGAVWQAQQGDIDAIVSARHPDPSAVLGPHAAPAGLAIGAFVPEASAVPAVDRAGQSLAAPVDAAMLKAGIRRAAGAGRLMQFDGVRTDVSWRLPAQRQLVGTGS